MLHFQVRPRPPFAFDLALAYLRASPSTVVEVISADAYQRVLRLPGPLGDRKVLLTVQAVPAAAVLDVTLAGPEVEPADRDAVEVLVRRLFAIDEDLTPFYVTIAADPVFAALAQRYVGLRPVIIPDLFETIVWAIIGQQINVKFAAKCKQALIDRFGERVSLGGHDYRLFPDPARLATVAEADLAAIQFSRQKIRYVLGVARDVATGRLVLDDLVGLPVEVAQAKLEGIHGVGRWTAEYVLMRGLGCRDVIPAADGGLRRVIGYAYGLGRSASEVEVRALADRWAGWRSYAAFYWWFTLQRDGVPRSSAGRPAGPGRASIRFTHDV